MRSFPVASFLHFVTRPCLHSLVTRFTASTEQHSAAHSLPLQEAQAAGIVLPTALRETLVLTVKKSGKFGGNALRCCSGNGAGDANEGPARSSKLNPIK